MSLHMESANYNDNYSNTSEFSDSNYKEISFKKGPKGFGFNIVGGIDQPYIPGNSGFFISRIRPSGAASVDGRLAVGDGLISVNGIKLLGLTHEEVVNIFNYVSSGSLTQLLVEKNAEKNILKKSFEASVSTTSFTSALRSAMSSGIVKSFSAFSAAATANEYSPEDSVKEDPSTVTDTNEFSYLSQTVPNPYVPPPSVVTVNGTEELPSLNSDNNEQVIDEIAILEVTNLESASHTQLTTMPSYAVKTAENINIYGSVAAHNVIREPIVNVLPDDRPDAVSTMSADTGQSNTNSLDGKYPHISMKCSPFHLNHNSVWTEAFFVAIGTVALGAMVFIGYRFIQRR